MATYSQSDLSKLGRKMKGLSRKQDEKSSELQGAAAAFARVKIILESAKPEPCLRMIVSQCEALDWFREHQQEAIEFASLTSRDVTAEQHSEVKAKEDLGCEECDADECGWEYGGLGPVSYIYVAESFGNRWDCTIYEEDDDFTSGAAGQTARRETTQAAWGKVMQVATHRMSRASRC